MLAEAQWFREGPARRSAALCAGWSAKGAKDRRQATSPRTLQGPGVPEAAAKRRFLNPLGPDDLTQQSSFIAAQTRGCLDVPLDHSNEDFCVVGNLSARPPRPPALSFGARARLSEHQKCGAQNTQRRRAPPRKCNSGENPYPILLKSESDGPLPSPRLCLSDPSCGALAASSFLFCLLLSLAGGRSRPMTEGRKGREAHGDRRSAGVPLKDKMTHHLGKCCKQARALFSKEHNPRAPRFQCWGLDVRWIPDAKYCPVGRRPRWSLLNIEIGGCGGAAPSPHPRGSPVRF